MRLQSLGGREVPTDTREGFLEAAFTLSMHLGEVEVDLKRLWNAAEELLYDDAEPKDEADRDGVFSDIRKAAENVSGAIGDLGSVKYNRLFRDVRDKVIDKVWNAEFGGKRR